MRRRSQIALLACAIIAAAPIAGCMSKAKKHLYKAEDLFEKRDLQGAKTELEQAVKEDPGLLDAHKSLAHVDEYLGIEREGTFESTAANLARSRPDCLYEGDRLPFNDGSFDTVLSIQVLEHTPDPRKLIAEMARVLNKGGTLILAAPFSFRLHEEPYDYFRYTPHGLRQLCNEAGLVIEHVEQVGSLWSLLGHKLNSYLAFHVARIGSAAQQLGKLAYESPRRTRPRLWVLPVVAPAILAIAAIARALDWIASGATATAGASKPTMVMHASSHSLSERPSCAETIS